MLKFNSLIPELSVRDLEKSLNFYVDDLGFKIEYTRDENRFAFISREGTQIMLEEGTRGDWNTGELVYPFGRGVNFSIEVTDMDNILEKFKRDNIEIKKPVDEEWYRFKGKMLGEKQLLVMDPDGYLLRLMEDLGEKEIKK